MGQFEAIESPQIAGENQLSENATYKDITDRGAKNSDYITFDYSRRVFIVGMMPYYLYTK